MARNLVILLDGTSNEIEEDRTNIVRLYGSLKRNADQIVFYDPGVGTLGAARAWTRWGTKAYEVLGLAFALGLDDNVKDAYRFLVEHWRKGDQIYIFGFSRGAYTARVLAGFIRTIGIISAEQINLLDYAYRAYKRVSDVGGFDKEVRLYERMLKAEQPPIRFLGLFDTVASVIVFKKVFPSLEYLPFTRTNHMVETVRHAVAIDERRSMFQPYFWGPGQKYTSSPVLPAGDRRDALPDQDFRELWFTGCHSDVGGGNPEKDSGLAKIPLVWMIGEAKDAGLSFTTQTVNRIVLGKGDNHDYVEPNPLGPINQSMTLLWRLVEILPKRRNPATSRKWHIGRWYIPFAERRRIADDALIHASVGERMAASDYAPPNLPEDPDFTAR